MIHYYLWTLDGRYILRESHLSLLIREQLLDIVYQYLPQQHAYFYAIVLFMFLLLMISCCRYPHCVSISTLIPMYQCRIDEDKHSNDGMVSELLPS